MHNIVRQPHYTCKAQCHIEGDGTHGGGTTLNCIPAQTQHTHTNTHTDRQADVQKFYTHIRYTLIARHTYIYTNTHTYLHTYTHIHIHLHAHVHIHTPHSSRGAGPPGGPGRPGAPWRPGPPTAPPGPRACAPPPPPPPAPPPRRAPRVPWPGRRAPPRSVSNSTTPSFDVPPGAAGALALACRGWCLACPQRCPARRMSRKRRGIMGICTCEETQWRWTCLLDWFRGLSRGVVCVAGIGGKSLGLASAARRLGCGCLAWPRRTPPKAAPAWQVDEETCLCLPPPLHSRS